MVFEIHNKVALITGGASGIGFWFAKELLQQGAKGITLADISVEAGSIAQKEMDETFGNNKAIFVETDVTNKQQFKNAFLKTIEHFGNIDILINNTGILNDALWEKEIQINIIGTVHGVLLGMEEYLPKYKQDEEALIVNISSLAGVDGFPNFPIYTASKHAVLGLVKSWGVPEHYEATKVRVIGVCPGVTITRMITDSSGKTLGDRYQQYSETYMGTWPSQEPAHVATEVMKVIKFAPNGTYWIIEGGESAYEYIAPNRKTMKVLLEKKT